jgi:hypothetical protein
MAMVATALPSRLVGVSPWDIGPWMPSNIWHQIGLLLILLVTSKGAAGVASAAIVVLAAIWCEKQHTGRERRIGESHQLNFTGTNGG